MLQRLTIWVLWCLQAVGEELSRGITEIKENRRSSESSADDLSTVPSEVSAAEQPPYLETMELTPSGGGNLDMSNRTSESSQSKEVIQLDGGGERRVEQSSNVQSEQRVQQSVSSKVTQSSSMVKQQSFSSTVKSSSSSQQVSVNQNGQEISEVTEAHTKQKDPAPPAPIEAPAPAEQKFVQPTDSTNNPPFLQSLSEEELQSFPPAQARPWEPTLPPAQTSQIQPQRQIWESSSYQTAPHLHALQQSLWTPSQQAPASQAIPEPTEPQAETPVWSAVTQTNQWPSQPKAWQNQQPAQSRPQSWHVQDQPADAEPQWKPVKSPGSLSALAEPERASSEPKQQPDQTELKQWQQFPQKQWREEWQEQQEKQKRVDPPDVLSKSGSDLPQENIRSSLNEIISDIEKAVDLTADLSLGDRQVDFSQGDVRPQESKVSQSPGDPSAYAPERLQHKLDRQTSTTSLERVLISQHSQPGDGLVAALSALLSPAATLPNLGAAPGAPTESSIPIPPPMPIPNMAHFLQSVQIARELNQVLGNCKEEESEEKTDDSAQQDENRHPWNPDGLHHKAIDLEKLFTPASDSGEVTPSRNRRMFASSSFYAPNHPTVEEQVELARRISASLSDISNQRSKGQTMYVHRKKRSVKWVHEAPLEDGTRASAPTTPAVDKGGADKPVLKLIMDPRGAVQDLSSLRRQGDNVEPALSPEVCFDLVRDLNAPKGKGAELFAKRRKKSEKWVVDETTVKTTSTSTTTGTSSGSMPMPVPSYLSDGAAKAQSISKMNEIQEKFSQPRLRLIKSPWDAALETGSVDGAFVETPTPLSNGGPQLPPPSPARTPTPSLGAPTWTATATASTTTTRRAGAAPSGTPGLYQPRAPRGWGSPLATTPTFGSVGFKVPCATSQSNMSAPRSYADPPIKSNASASDTDVDAPKLGAIDINDSKPDNVSSVDVSETAPNIEEVPSEISPTEDSVPEVKTATTDDKTLLGKSSPVQAEEETKVCRHTSSPESIKAACTEEAKSTDPDVDADEEVHRHFKKDIISNEKKKRHKPPTEVAGARPLYGDIDPTAVQLRPVHRVDGSSSSNHIRPIHKASDTLVLGETNVVKPVPKTVSPPKIERARTPDKEPMRLEKVLNTEDAKKTEGERKSPCVEERLATPSVDEDLVAMNDQKSSHLEETPNSPEREEKEENEKPSEERHKPPEEVVGAKPLYGNIDPSSVHLRPVHKELKFSDSISREHSVESDSMSDLSPTRPVGPLLGRLPFGSIREEPQSLTVSKEVVDYGPIPVKSLIDSFEKGTIPKRADTDDEFYVCKTSVQTRLFREEDPTRATMISELGIRDNGVSEDYTPSNLSRFLTEMTQASLLSTNSCNARQTKVLVPQVRQEDVLEVERAKRELEEMIQKTYPNANLDIEPEVTPTKPTYPAHPLLQQKFQNLPKPWNPDAYRPLGENNSSTAGRANEGVSGSALSSYRTPEEPAPLLLREAACSGSSGPKTNGAPAVPPRSVFLDYSNFHNYNTAPRGWGPTMDYYRPVTFGKPIAASDF